ncbi:FtsX-like permease family protein [Sulfurimonas aquatica]|uniref:FtsX-like permease family protein n=1 Tax=Sulfurimonas aquatica TaxID=2672570 RepID=A0A975B0K3_9BACT|nr:FtsX-like permease family protein [Sulfurimonas aquatica]QSZ42016.1 FtsX-like permease family protein [Sulfurimonas aquatica]
MFSLAIKNILFYRSRSITTIILTFISALLFIVYVSMMDGSHDSMLKNALKVYTGPIEIYKKGYRDIGGNEYLIRDVNAITQKLSRIEGIKSYTSRYETYALLSSKEYSTASMIAGVTPEDEKSMSQLEVALTEGKFLTEDDANCIYAGEGVVKKLHIKLGDEVSFIGSASDNSFAADIFRLCGIFKTGSFEFDASSAFVSRSYFDTLTYSMNTASYINIHVENLENVDLIKEEISKLLDDDLEILTWKELMKPMVEAMKVDSIFGYISISLFFVVIFFVIMIFSFINVSSRVKEFGVLRSIGLSKSNVTRLLTYEMFILSTLAILIATPIGAYIAYYFSLYPIIIEGMSETYKEYGVISDELPFNFDVFTITWNVLLIYSLNFLSILYPILYINAFNPIEATKHV